MATLPFDTLRGTFSLGNPEEDYIQNVEALGSMRSGEELQNLQPFDPRAAAAQPGFSEEQKALAQAQSDQQAYSMRRAGFVENAQGNLVDPTRNVAVNRDIRLRMMQEVDRKEREAIADSMLFKTGDTLADAGRMFLSPLFWLKGEDQSQYDPSDRLKTGYRTQFMALEELRDANYLKFQGSRDARNAAAQQLDYQRRTLAQSSLSSEEKRLRNYAARTNRMDMYSDPLQQEKLARLEAFDRNQAVRLTDSAGEEFYFFNIESQELQRRGKAFLDQTENLRESFGSIERLMNIDIGDASGITDVAAIFDFIKGIDPGSVVRESEVNLFQNTIGLMDRIIQSTKQVKEGRVLSDDQLRELKKYAKRLAGMMSSSFNERKDAARKALRESGLNSEELQDSYLGAFKPPSIPNDATDNFDSGAQIIPGSTLDQLMKGSLEDQILAMQNPVDPEAMGGVSVTTPSYAPGQIRSPLQ